MPRFAANLTFLFKEVPFLDRFALAKAAGFGAVEILFPYDHPAEDIADRLHGSDLDLALINTPAADWAEGGRGRAAIPGAEQGFREDFALALRYAERLNPKHVHVMAGLAKGAAAEEAFIANLAWAAAQAPERSLTIEPINPIDMPGYFLNSFDRASRIIEAVGAPNLGLQFDAYHAQAITGDVPGTWARHGHLVRHIQIAGWPGRHEPMKGEIDYPAFFAQLDAEGYDGLVSGEYRPAGETLDGLSWMESS